MVFAPQGKHTLSHRVFVTIFVCAMAVIVAFTVLGAFFVQNTLADATSANLAQETELIAAALDEQQEPIPFLRSLDREDLRITLINKDGSVAYDNEASPSTLPNHGDRPEVIEAFESGLGSAERASSTLDEIMLYRAVALDNGQVVRLAQAQPGVAAILLSMVAPMLLIAAAGAVLSFFMARRESRAIIAPLQEVDLDHPRRSYEHAYAEMVPMLERIESQRQELKRQMAVLADNDRMRREFKVECNQGKPQVAYRETIRRPADQDTKYARQSGGKGQYGHVKIHVEPNEPGKGYEFINAVVGGAIPKEYIPAVDAGIQGAMEAGVLAGYPVVDVKVTLYDGSYHEVDSSEMAFKIAGSMAFKEACKKANPVILEPIMKVSVNVPDEYMGTVIGDITARRGNILGQITRTGSVQIDANVPLAEMFGYATDLRSKTQGRGNYSMEPSHNAELPKSKTEEIVKSRGKD